MRGRPPSSRDGDFEASWGTERGSLQYSPRRFLSSFSILPLSLVWMGFHLQSLEGIWVAFPESLEGILVGFPPTWPPWPKTLAHLQAADGFVWGSEGTSPPCRHIWVRSFHLSCWALPLPGPCVSRHGTFELEMCLLVCGMWLDQLLAGWISASTGHLSEGSLGNIQAPRTMGLSRGRL